MGTIQHHAIIVTAQDADCEPAHAEAVRLGMNVSPISEPAINAYCSFAIFPDGSKLGWSASDEGNDRRAAFKSWLGSNGRRVSWVEVTFGECGHNVVDGSSSDD